MRASRNTPKIQAGSMADIAFLLLIFFLVTAYIPNDQGILRKLPAPCTSGDCMVEVKERNVLRLVLNETGEVLVNDEKVALSELSEQVQQFVDNNGEGACSYCHGLKSEKASEHPKNAVMSLQSSNKASYEKYIAVQNELTRAYEALRTKYVLEVLKTTPEKVTPEQLLEVRDAYPFQLSEATLRNPN